MDRDNFLAGLHISFDSVKNKIDQHLLAVVFQIEKKGPTEVH